MLDIQNLFATTNHHLGSLQAREVGSPPRPVTPDFVSPAEIRSSLTMMKSLTKIFSRELSFDYNEELNRVIVKVVDKNTDAVIKEIPPAEVHRMLLRIRDAVGLIIDQLI